MSKSRSYKKGGGTTNLYEDCKSNKYEDGIPSENKIVLGNACYNKESLCQWLHINPTDPLTRETVPDEWMIINCPKSLVTRILGNNIIMGLLLFFRIYIKFYALRNTT